MSDNNALLQAIANPKVVDPLNALSSAAQTANQVWRARQFQARQAAGQAYQQATDPNTGQVDPARAQAIMAADPRAALAAQDSATTGQALAGDQQGQAIKSMATMSATLDSLGPNATHQQVVDALKEGVSAGWIQPQGANSVLVGLPDGDDEQSVATRGHVLKTIGDRIRSASERLQSQYGAPFTQTGPNGQTIGGTVDQRTGAVSSPQQAGAPQGPDQGSLGQVSTITNADGSNVTDTLRGHIAAGRVSPTTGQPMPGFSAPQQAGSPGMVQALRGQEGTPNGQTSVAGARGQMQVTPAFFKQYAQPGESFDSKRDVEAVAARGIGALEAQYPGDPGRVATAYFSGQGNVSPAGSATPYLVDKRDANGATTSGYVAGAVQRFGAAQRTQRPAASPAPAPGAGAPATAAVPMPSGPRQGGTTVQPGTVEQNKIDQQQYNERTVAYNNNEANLIANYKEAYSLGQKITTGTGTANLAAMRSGIVSLERVFGVEPGPMATSDQARGELDKVLNQILISQPGAGRSNEALGTAAAGSPHMQMNTAAMLNQVRILYGQAKQQNAAMLEHDPAANGVGYQEHNRTMLSTTARDGFASDLMTPDEIHANLTRLGPDTPAGKAFKRAVVKNAALYGGQPGIGVGQ